MSEPSATGDGVRAPKLRIWYQGISSEAVWPRYYQQLAKYLATISPGTDFTVKGIPHGSLGDQFRLIEFLDTRDLIRNALIAERNGYDVLIIGNTQDAGLLPLRETLSMPVLGILQSSLLVGSLMGTGISLVAPGARFVPRWREIIGQYGLMDLIVSIESMDYSPPDLDQQFTNPAFGAELIDRFEDAAQKALVKGAEVVIPVGASVALFLAQRNVRHVQDALVLDPVAIVVKLAESISGLRQIMGTWVSRRLSFQSPPRALLDEVLRRYELP